LAIEPMYEESKASWASVLENLKTRRFEEVWLGVSDAHKGIQKAVKQCLLDVQ